MKYLPSYSVVDCNNYLPKLSSHMPCVRRSFCLQLGIEIKLTFVLLSIRDGQAEPGTLSKLNVFHTMLEYLDLLKV